MCVVICSCCQALPACSCLFTDATAAPVAQLKFLAEPLYRLHPVAQHLQLHAQSYRNILYACYVDVPTQSPCMEAMDAYLQWYSYSWSIQPNCNCIL